MKKIFLRIMLPLLLGSLAAYLAFISYKTYGVYDYKTITIVCISACVLGYVLFNFQSYSDRCIECERWSAIEEVSRKCIDKILSHKKKTLTRKDSSGKVISTREVIVPATKYTYNIHDKCKYCGYAVNYIETVTREN